MNRPVIYIFMNKDLHMSAGKLAAQAAHALGEVAEHTTRPLWRGAPHHTILIMEARDQQHMENIAKYLMDNDRNIFTYPVIDEGINETDPHVMTALATTVLDKDDPKTDMTMSTFKIYRELIKTTLEFER